MCGICGYTGEELPDLLHQMCAAIEHRGPDAEGLLQRPGIHLGNRRLRVLDVEGGDQPIYSEDGKVGVVYNGEIYNFRELRRELEARGHTFKTQADTEVIVHLYEEYGTDCPTHLDGMFTFALHDERRDLLLLARDPVGIKPLVYHWNGSTLVFGSEAKSLLLHPSVTPALDPDGLHMLLNVRFIPGPRTMFRNIRQLPPGHRLVLENGKLKEERYHSWDFTERRDRSPREAGEEFLHILQRSVDRQRVADVPLGIYLSGGLDSSSLVAGAMAGGGGARLRTFALGFGEPTDELADARRVADHFSTEHRDITLSADPLRLYPRIVYHAEAPKVNAPQGYYLSRFAREKVTVALSGLGGDELFLGYDLYRHLWPGSVLIDSPLAALLSLGGGLADTAAGLLDRLAGPPGENRRRMTELLACGGDPLRYYLTLRNGWDLRRGAEKKIYTDAWRQKLTATTRDAFAPYFDRPDLPFLEQVQFAEFRAKMVDDFLLNEDRMSMANSLEVRVPLLDMEMIRFAFSLPRRIKREGGRLKPVMKRGLSRVLPPEVLRKKKWGFTANPYHQFRKDLRALCERELTREFIGEQGVFQYGFVRAILDHKPTPLMRWHYFMIWQMLGLKFWQEIFLEGKDWREVEDRVKAAKR